MLGTRTIQKVNAFFRLKELTEQYLGFYGEVPEAWTRLEREYGDRDEFGQLYPLDKYAVPLIDLEDAIETLERELQNENR